jgi:copper(I)-binding protein
MKTKSLLAGLSLLCAFAAQAAAPRDLAVTDAWVRGTVPGQTATGAYMNLTSTVDAVLVGAASPVAAVVEIHEMKMDGNVMQMRAVPRLDLPAGKIVRLDATSAYHVMLMDLKRPLHKGETVPLTLRIEHAGKKIKSVTVKAEVRDLTDAGNPVAVEGATANHEHHH